MSLALVSLHMNLPGDGIHTIVSLTLASLSYPQGGWGPGWYLARGRSTMNSEGMSYYLMATEGWMDGRVDEWMEEWVDGWRGEWVSG